MHKQFIKIPMTRVPIGFKKMSSIIALPLRVNNQFSYFTFRSTPLISPNGILGKLNAFTERKWNYYSNLPTTKIRYKLFSLVDKLITKKHIQEQFLKHIDRSCGSIEVLIPKQVDTNLFKSEFEAMLYEREMYHRKWLLVNYGMAVPLLILTVLPGVKMLVGWNWYRIWANYLCWKGAIHLRKVLIFKRNETLSLIYEKDDKQLFDLLLKEFNSQEFSHFLFHLRSQNKITQ